MNPTGFLPVLMRFRKILRNGLSIDTTLAAIIEVIPQAFRSPELIKSRIKYDDQEFSSSGFAETPWLLKVFFKTISAKRGSIQVYYTGDDPETNEQPFLEEEKQFVETLALLISGFINVIYGLDRVIATERGLKKIMYEKTERLKELSCINQTTSILQAEKSVENALKQIVYIIPDAWQYPGYTVARISYDGQEYISPNFKTTKWRQRQPFPHNR